MCSGMSGPPFATCASIRDCSSANTPGRIRCPDSLSVAIVEKRFYTRARVRGRQPRCTSSRLARSAVAYLALALSLSRPSPPSPPSPSRSRRPRRAGADAVRSLAGPVPHVVGARLRPVRGARARMRPPPRPWKKRARRCRPGRARAPAGLWRSRLRSRPLGGADVHHPALPRPSRAGHEAETAAYVTRKAHEAQRFAGLSLPADVARKLHLLVVTQEDPRAVRIPSRRRSSPAPSRPWTSAYGPKEVLPAEGLQAHPFPRSPPPLGETCLHLDDLDGVLQKSRDAGVLTEAWNAWYETARRQLRSLREVRRRGQRGERAELGFLTSAPCGAPTSTRPPPTSRPTPTASGPVRSPSCEELHCYVRAKLARQVREGQDPRARPHPRAIPPATWAQSWEGIFDLVVPYKGEPSLDVSKALRAARRRQVDGEDGRELLHLHRLLSAPRDLLGALAAHAPSRPRGPLPRLRLGRELGRGPPHQDVHHARRGEPRHDPPRARSRLLLPVVRQAPAPLSVWRQRGLPGGARRHDRAQRDAALPEEPRPPRRAPHRRQVAHQRADEDGAGQGGLLAVRPAHRQVALGRLRREDRPRPLQRHVVGSGARLPRRRPAGGAHRGRLRSAAKYHVASATPTSSTSSPPSTSSSSIAPSAAPRASMDRSTSAPSTRAPPPARSSARCCRWARASLGKTRWKP